MIDDNISFAICKNDIIVPTQPMELDAAVLMTLLR